MSAITITKVKVIKGGQKLEVKYKQDGALKSSNDTTGDNPVHPDLLTAVQSLAVHLALITDVLQEKKATDSKEIEKFVVTGYSIGGHEDDHGITITGYRKGKYGTVTLNSPFTRFEASDENKYSLLEDLLSKIDTIEEEVEEYLFKGKKAPEAQQQIDFDKIPGEGKTTINVLAPSTDKNPFKKKGESIKPEKKTPAKKDTKN